MLGILINLKRLSNKNALTNFQTQFGFKKDHWVSRCKQTQKNPEIELIDKIHATKCDIEFTK